MVEAADQAVLSWFAAAFEVYLALKVSLIDSTSRRTVRRRRPSLGYLTSP
jgi:hypothetical protein